MDGLISSIPQADLPELVHASMKDGDGFLRAFRMTSGMKSSVCLTSMRCFPFGGIQYRDILVAPVKVYFYHFNEPSPYPGPTPGLPYDGQGALFVYQKGNGTRSVISKDYCGEYERSGLPLQMAMMCHGSNMGRLITSCIWGQMERYLCRLCRLSVSGNTSGLIGRMRTMRISSNLREC